MADVIALVLAKSSQCEADGRSDQRPTCGRRTGLEPGKLADIVNISRDLYAQRTFINGIELAVSVSSRSDRSIVSR